MVLHQMRILWFIACIYCCRILGAKSHSSLSTNADCDNNQGYAIRRRISNDKSSTTYVSDALQNLLTSSSQLAGASSPSVPSPTQAAPSATSQGNSPALKPPQLVASTATSSSSTSTSSTVVKTKSKSNSTLPNSSSETVTYSPGTLTVRQNGLLLSQGLSCRVLATVRQLVAYDNGKVSTTQCHTKPDGGATFKDPRPSNAGGYIYVSNSEDTSTRNLGGVTAFTFDRNGKLFDYRYVLTGTRRNCGGSSTPWGALISCEEYSDGRIWQVDPTGEREGKPVTLGSEGGYFESFAHDVRDHKAPKFYVTEDRKTGPVRQFIPTAADWSDPWSILLGPGTTTYLVMVPDEWGGSTDKFTFTADLELAKNNAYFVYPSCEGINVVDNTMYLLSKVFKTMFALNLDGGVYTNYTTHQGLFDGQPDQVETILGQNDDMLYFTEEGGQYAGIHARNAKGDFFTILEYTDGVDESTGLAFSPDAKKL
jgi:uncharacterized protein